MAEDQKPKRQREIEYEIGVIKEKKAYLKKELERLKKRDIELIKELKKICVHDGLEYTGYVRREFDPQSGEYKMFPEYNCSICGLNVLERDIPSEKLNKNGT